MTPATPTAAALLELTCDEARGVGGVGAGEELVHDGHVGGAEPTAGCPHDVVVLEADPVGQERTAGGLTPDQVEHPVAHAGTVGEPERRPRLGRLSLHQRVVEQAPVLSEALSECVLGGSHVAGDGRLG